MKVCLDFPASFVDGGAVRDLGPTLRNLILEVFPLGKIFQPDDSWNKRASSKMQAFLGLFWESFVLPCALIPPHTREGNSVMLWSIPVSSLHRFSVINAFISFSFLQVLKFDCPITKKHTTIELSPDLNLILSDLCLLIFKTTGRQGN